MNSRHEPSVGAELVHSFAEATRVMALIEASCSADQDMLGESLDIDPAASLVRDTAPSGDRRFRACLSGGVGIVYSALVENRIRQVLPARCRQPLWAELPEHASSSGSRWR